MAGYNKKNKQNADNITEEQLFDVLEFARQAYNGGYPNVFTPDLINAKMQDVNLNPLKGTKEEIERALADPKNNEEKLIGYSEFFELTSMIYKRMLYYLAHLLSFSVKDIICKNAQAKDYNSSKYKKDYAILCDFLDKFDIKQEFSKVMRELLRKDSSFWVIRNEGDKYTLQELPSKYCKITGRWSYGLLFDFNMYWFLNSGVDINMYPDVFKEMYNRVMYDNEGNYKPASSAQNRNGNWTLWTQTSPLDGFWAWKLTPELVTNIPFLAPLFQDVVLQPLIRNLQTNKYMIEATKVMVGLIPMIKDAKGGHMKDMIGISDVTAGKFLNLIKKGIGDVIKTGAAPFEDIKTLDFEGSTRNMLEDYARTTTSLSGVNSRLIFTSDKPNIMETQLSLDVDVMTLSYMYAYFEDFLNYQINSLTKDFKFKIKLGGINTTEDIKDRRKEFVELSAIGVVLPDRLAFSLDMYPHHLEKQMEKAKASKFADNLMPMLNIYTDSATGNEGGRPKSDTSQLTDSGASERSNNIQE